MTTSARAKRGLYPENPPTNEPCAKQCKNGRPVIPAIQSDRTNMPLWKAVAFAAASVSIAIRCMPRRPEFATILKTEGVDGLTSALNRRAEALGMSAARTL